MPSIEARTVDGDAAQSLEDVLTTIPLLKAPNPPLTKPNAIVHPIPRVPAPPASASASQQHPTASRNGGFLAQLEAQIQRPGAERLDTNQSAAEQRKNHSGVIPKRKQVNVSGQDVARDVSNGFCASRSKVPMDPLLQKPLFITTVPTGVFLEPDATADSVQRKIYHYQSHPRVLRSTHHAETQSFLAKLSSATKRNLFAGPGGEWKSQKGGR